MGCMEVGGWVHEPHRSGWLAGWRHMPDVMQGWGRPGGHGRGLGSGAGHTHLRHLRVWRVVILLCRGVHLAVAGPVTERLSGYGMRLLLLLLLSGD